METFAAQLRAAFNERDIDALRGLIAEDARWGEAGAPNSCQTRDEIIAYVKRLLDDGVDPTIIETATGPRGVACVVEVLWPEPEAWRPQRETIYQVFLVADRRIVEIQGHDDEESALAAITG